MGVNIVVVLEEVREDDRPRVGGKGFALSTMARSGITVPPAVCVTVEAYQWYMRETGLGERILLELNRKNFKDMRWEEMWDASLRIRNMFLTTPMPDALMSALRGPLARHVGHAPVVVRSSAPEEDSHQASFAGLHESYVNISGIDSILEHIRLVWASLWSDAALLYRQELGLDIARSTMAVVVQRIVIGDCSGVVFGENPTDASQAVIEAVYGLNQGLVDGTVEPDQWVVDREHGGILDHVSVRREMAVVPAGDGVVLAPLPPDKCGMPPLNRHQVSMVYELARKAESLFGKPQDVEWTFLGNALHTLQARPITTRADDDHEDQRSWYLSLRRSFENLKVLQNKIEGDLIPAMIREADGMAGVRVEDCTDAELADEIAQRAQVHKHWVDIYWKDFIPFAHGMRLFGQMYNDVIHPADPYEFMDLLATGDMMSVQRNRMLEQMASMVRDDPHRVEDLREGRRPSKELEAALDAFVENFGDLSCGSAQCVQGREPIINLVLEMAAHSATGRRRRVKDIEELTRAYLAHVTADQQDYAAELLDLARASYRLRDDDNVYLGRIEGQLTRAVDEGRRRIAERGRLGVDQLEVADVIALLKDPTHVPEERRSAPRVAEVFEVKARQLQGQPAGSGFATGPARVILDAAHLLDFKAGEILVCDAVDPSLTFVVPLAAGIVERRGGMLIHGAIIAREYGLPCVTGVADATALIRTGNRITVDGYLGIVIIDEVAP